MPVDDPTPPAGLPAFRAALREGGVPAALALLNGRTPHRFTGIYRYDVEMLRNVALFDRFNPELRSGADVAMEDAYCAIVGHTGQPLEFADARTDPHVQHLPGSPVVCYCGVLISAPDGSPFGTLCHFDLQLCEMRTGDLPLLQAAAPLIYAAVQSLAGARAE